MRSSGDLFRGGLAFGLSLALAGCGGGDRPQSVVAAQPDATGPAADYPMVLGDPFTVDGVEYVPTDAMNYDEVGYLAADGAAGPGVTASHRTLPLPSYIEVTSLASGRTILARVERRGPMTGARLLALSPEALAQLGEAEGAAVRVRRVNPPEVQRAELRAGRAAPLRMDTPETLLGVLRRKLPGDGSASLAGATSPPVPSGVQAGAAPESAPQPTESLALAPLESAATPRTAQARTQTPPAPAATGTFVVQAAAFSSEANAQRAAKALGGFVATSGRLHHVRTGPYQTRGQAEAALAKVRAAGYSDARVSTTQ
ncbi:SPOR domain-containing protein [Pelagerythrobacter sp.]|uniref:SPOR domain-containing protein n=1 Tax=Pelagerythrobacter sp. TaxID=2800702 RepID=UPI0035B4289E